MSTTSQEINLHFKAFITSTLPHLEKIIAPFLLRYPHWQLAFHSAIGAYGYYMALKQEEVNAYVEFIKKYPQVFRKEIVESKEFRDAFVISFQDYLKARSEKKKELVKKIFMGFTVSGNKDEFALEHLDNILIEISPTTLGVLIFIQQEIIPIKQKNIRDELETKNIKHSGKSIEWWYQQDWRREPISKFIQKWIFDNYNPNSTMVKKKYKVKEKWKRESISKVFDNERKKQIEITAAIDELVNLGIMKIRVSGGTIGSGAGAEYEFTVLGEEFLKFLNEV